MQRRLLISTLAVAVVAVLLLGLPLAFVLSRLQAGEAGQELRRDATTLATGLQERVNSGLPADAAQVAKSLPDRYVTISERGAVAIRVGSKPPSGDTITGRASTKDFSVTVAADDSFVSGRIVGGLVLIGSLSLLAVMAAVALAILQARRLTRPMLDLARAADLLGSGAARPLGRRYGLPEPTGWPRAWTARPSGSPNCCRRSGPSPSTPRTSCGLRSPPCPCGWRK